MFTHNLNINGLTRQKIQQEKTIDYWNFFSEFWYVGSFWKKETKKLVCLEYPPDSKAKTSHPIKFLRPE